MMTPCFAKKNGIPFVSGADLDKLAELMLAEYCPQSLMEPTEIDIDLLVQDYLGMEQDFQYLSHNGMFLGMTVFNDTQIPVYDPERNRAEFIGVKARTVIIDNRLLDKKQEHRYRFTMGHEAAHGVLHTSYFNFCPDQLALYDMSAQPMIQCSLRASTRKPASQWTSIDRMEWQANRLSSALLMPRCAVQKLVQRYNYTVPTGYVWKVVDAFNVSVQAAFYRLKELGYISKSMGLHQLDGYPNRADIVFTD